MGGNKRIPIDWLMEESLPIEIVSRGLELACGINSSATLNLYLEAKDRLTENPKKYRGPEIIYIAEEMIRLAKRKYGFKGGELELEGETKSFLYFFPNFKTWRG